MHGWEFWQNYTASYKEHGCKKINFFFRSLYAGDLWLESAYAKTLANALLQFVRAYLLLAHMSYDLGEISLG